MYTVSLLDFYTERVSKRNSENYAYAIYNFFSDEQTQKIIDSQLGDDPNAVFYTEHPAKFEYVTRRDPTDEKKYIIAQRMMFQDIGAFLHMELFSAFSLGNAPRRCHNCNRYFLLTDGYDTRYCNLIDPTDPKGRTCSKIGAHKEEASRRDKAPYQIEYTRADDRMKKAKSKRIITHERYNEYMSMAMKISELCEKGKLSDTKMQELFKKISIKNRNYHMNDMLKDLGEFKNPSPEKKKHFLDIISLQ